ncbi:MAG: phosphate acyltransferase PlsX [Candidatus Babeliales bacterium]|nr:phosphate acyltransferase PlsX [Candidatus Babeliales bacterium]
MIAIDAMGGDFAPQAIVHGAFNAAQKGIPVNLFGDSAQIKSILINCASQASISSWHILPITITHTTQIISMGQEPTRTVIAKKDSSLVRAVQAVADGTCSAIITAGNSGAAMVAGTFILGRVEGVLRPAIGEFIPTKNGSIFCMDLGANTDCKPEFLEQFAYMGHAYVSIFKAIPTPRIALLSNGHEPYKGAMAVKQTFDKLTNSSLNFVGNLESRDMFDDHADVLVCDGFVGNVLLKGLEGTTRAITYWINAERKKSWLYSIGLFLAKGLFKNLKQKIDYAQFGGALLLGVNKPLIIAHGCSNAFAIERSIIFAHKVSQEKLVELFNTKLKQLLPGTSIMPEFIPAQKLPHAEL